MALKQETRFLSLQTPLGENELLLTAFRGHEELSRLFHFELEMISDNAAIQATDIVGKNVTFSVKLADDSPRVFNGFVSRFSAGDEEHGRRNYRAEIVPWLWFLTQTADCRIFQNMTVPDIIEQIFQDLGFSDYETSEIRGDHKEWEYCVQYRETDFNFVSRLMEQEGIFYYFRHEDGKHTLVLADQKGAYKDCSENEVEYPPSQAPQAITDHITSWEHRYEFRPGKWAQTDYNFETPSSDLMTQTNTIVKLPGVDKYEIYDYPGEYPDKGAGDGETKIRMEEEEVPHDVVYAASTCKTFTPGGKFTVAVHRSSSEEGKTFVIASIQHSATEPMAYEAGGAVGEDYSNTFTCIPDSVTFRPARVTPKPIVSGCQTAVVVGPSGEEIYTDEYGRVKVQFFWDREGKKDENSSCWIRVAQNWAGEKWGIVFNPRIGQEMVVDFLEGDPDRPIITGRVYNAEQMPPYNLPAEQTKSTLKTRSSKDGSADNFNELRFEDKKGEEEIYLHAERDFNRAVENNDTLKVGFDKKDPGDQTIEIWNNRTETVKQGDEKVTIEQGHRTVTVGQGNDTHLIRKGDRSVQIDLGNDTLNIKMGNQTTKLDLGKSETQAMQSIELKVGQSSIKLDQSGVTIKGMKISVDGQLMTEVKGLMTQVKGDAMLVAKGGVTMIN